MRRYWKPWWPWYGRALAIASALYAGVSQARATNFPSAEFWTANDSIRFAVAVAGVINAVLVAVQLWRLTDRLVTARRTKHVRNAAAFVLERVCNASRMSLWPTKMAVHVWVVPRRRGSIARDQPLRRLCSYQITNHNRSGVDWTIGKGVVGRVWETREGLVANLEPLVAAQRKGEPTFNKRTESNRLGMTFDDVHRTKRYTAIFAHPLYNRDGELIGIVSIDSTQRQAWEPLRASVSGDMVATAIEGVETALAQLQSPTEEPGE